MRESNKTIITNRYGEGDRLASRPSPHVTGASTAAGKAKLYGNSGVSHGVRLEYLRQNNTVTAIFMCEWWGDQEEGRKRAGSTLPFRKHVTLTVHWSPN